MVKVMGKLINKTQNNFTQITNNLVNDTRLSLKSKGLYLYLASKPDDWDFYISEIASKNKDGKEAVRAGLKELERNGYLVRHQKRKSDGTYNYDYELFIEPLSEPVDFMEHNNIKSNLSTKGKLTDGYPTDENLPHISNTKNTNTNITNTQISNSTSTQSTTTKIQKDIDIELDISVSNLEYRDSLGNWFMSNEYENSEGLTRNRIHDVLYPEDNNANKMDIVYDKINKIGSLIKEQKMKPVKYPYRYLKSCLKR